eukprot:7121629-Prymnesium_polylepis.1
MLFCGVRLEHHGEHGRHESSNAPAKEWRHRRVDPQRQQRPVDYDNERRQGRDHVLQREAVHLDLHEARVGGLHGRLHGRVVMKRPSRYARPLICRSEVSCPLPAGRTNIRKRQAHAEPDRLIIKRKEVVGPHVVEPHLRARTTQAAVRVRPRRS